MLTKSTASSSYEFSFQRAIRYDIKTQNIKEKLKKDQKIKS